MMGSSAVLILVSAFFVLLAGLFGGAETGMYQLSRVRLRLGMEKKRLRYVLLGHVMTDSSRLLLTTLIGTNLAHYLATSSLTYWLLERLGQENAEFLAMFVATPVMFVFSDLIPKNIFLCRADSLMPWVAPVLYIFSKAFTWCGVAPLLGLISRRFSRLAGLEGSSKTAMTAAGRHRVRAILQDTHEEDMLSPVQREMVERIVSIPAVRIRSVMIPMARVHTVRIDCDRAGLLKKLQQAAFSRLPVYDRRGREVLGYVNIYEALSEAGDFSDLGRFVKPIRRLDAGTAVTEAINVMRNENLRIVLVSRGGRRGRGRPLGIVTMKDLAEELLGELAEW